MLFTAKSLFKFGLVAIHSYQSILCWLLRLVILFSGVYSHFSKTPTQTTVIESAYTHFILISVYLLDPVTFVTHLEEYYAYLHTKIMHANNLT